MSLVTTFKQKDGNWVIARLWAEKTIPKKGAYSTREAAEKAARLYAKTNKLPFLFNQEKREFISVQRIDGYKYAVRVYVPEQLMENKLVHKEIKPVSVNSTIAANEVVELAKNQRFPSVPNFFCDDVVPSSLNSEQELQEKTFAKCWGSIAESLDLGKDAKDWMPDEARIWLNDPQNTEFLKKPVKLYLSTLSLTKIPAEIFKLNIVVLDLGDNDLTELPKELFQMKNLTELYLDLNKLKSFGSPQFKEEGSRIKKLTLSRNCSLKSLLGNFENLEILAVDDTELYELPKELEKSPLNALNIKGNSKISLSQQLINQLKYFYAEGTPYEKLSKINPDKNPFAVPFSCNEEPVEESLSSLTIEKPPEDEKKT
jgi:hypothetical protein